MKTVQIEGFAQKVRALDVRFRINRSGNAHQRRKAIRQLKRDGYVWEPQFHGYVNWQGLPQRGRKIITNAMDELVREVEADVLSRLPIASDTAFSRMLRGA